MAKILLVIFGTVEWRYLMRSESNVLQQKKSPLTATTVQIADLLVVVQTYWLHLLIGVIFGSATAGIVSYLSNKDMLKIDSVAVIFNVKSNLVESSPHDGF